MKDGKRKISILTQAALLFAAAVIATGILASLILYRYSWNTVVNGLKTRAQASASDVEGYIRQYPASEWLLDYWHEYGSMMDIEYDAVYDKNNRTAAKVRLLADRHPEFQPLYADAADVEALGADDRKLYAEIAYSWLITSVDQIVKFHGFDYLMCVCTNEPYDAERVLFIAAREGEERGEGKGQIYPLGKVLNTNAKQQEAIRNAVAGEPSTAYNEDGKYIDYYYSIGSYGGHQLLIIMTNKVMNLRTDTWNRALSMGMNAMIFLIVLALLCLGLIHYAVLKPLRGVQANIRLYKDTKDSAAVVRNLSKIRSHNELSQLSEDVAALTTEIDQHIAKIEKITAEKEKLGTELELASRIQTAMLPNEFPAFPDRDEFDVFASCTPAREVGGDFYDYFLIDDDHLCILIADVSGKSVPAALFMMAAKITIAHYARENTSPAQILTEVNEAICRHNPEEMFITVWLGILELSTGKLTAVNAGHEYPAVMEPSENFRMLKDMHFFVVGAYAEVFYRDYVIQMKPGSKLFLYTDGLAETTNAKHEMFGTERILEVLNTHKDDSLQTLLDEMKDAAFAFAGNAEQFDDLTMVCLSYHGPQKQDNS